jgi:glycosyltransferase involved in cell wall biosynthesis
MLICAPVSSRSGYGDHSRDLVRSFLQHDKYDIKIIDVPWGDCPRNALDENNSDDKKMIDCFLSQPQLDKQPDIYVDIRIPNEFQTYGKFNIGVTAGIETNAVSQNWLESCNKMDLVIVPSEHSKEGFVKTMFDKINNLPDGNQQKVGELKLEKPIEVLFEGSDENIYKPIDNVSLDLVDDIKEDFCFLHVGQWTKGDYGEDRKDIAKLVKVFYESFANKKKQPALVLKSNGAAYSILDREECLNKINNIKNMFPRDWNLPSIYLLHGSLSSDEMNKLYNHSKIKAFISLTHGEGYGRPLQEATMVGLPVITSAWSGHMDFNVNEQQTYKALNYCFDNYDKVKKKALNLMKINRDKFTLNKMTEKLDEIMEKHTKDIPQQVGLQLPKLKKVDDKSEPPKIKLPKLKKVTS